MQKINFTVPRSLELPACGVTGTMEGYEQPAR